MSCRTSKIPLSLCALLVVALVGAAGCGKASPTAPTGSTLTLTVNPVSVVSPRGSATLTAFLKRPNGTPEPGAQVQFSATLGVISSPTVTTDNNGKAVSTLTGDGRIGTSKVTAFSGAVMSSEVDVTIGAQAGSVVLTASPSTVTQISDNTKTDTVTLTALVKDAQGNPVPESPVVFSSQAGTLSENGFETTNSAGVAVSTLTLSAVDLNNQSGDTFNVSAQGNGSGSPATFAINIARPPVASFTVNVPTGSLSASFTDTSTHHPTSWQWDFGEKGSPSNSSTSQNPAHTYLAKGTYIVTLTVMNGVGSGTTSQAVCVNCSTP